MPNTARFTRRATLAFLGVAPFSASCASAQLAQIEGGSVSIDGRAVAYKYRPGHGPTIVFESGLGDGLESWDNLLPLLPQGSPIFSYSRPGYGQSSPAPVENGMRTAEEAARHLHRVLAAARVPAPYVLVGHSLGGLYIIRFAELFPSTVSGLVFVDARPPSFFRHCVEEGAACGTRAASPADWPADILAERAGIEEAELHGLPRERIGHIPATIITAVTPPPSEDGVRFRRIWIAEQHTMTDAFADHRFVEAPNASHYVHRDAPELVAREIALRVGA